MSMIIHQVCISDLCLCKRDENLDEAISRLRMLKVID